MSFAYRISFFSGHFGSVYLGVYSEEDKNLDVAVKTLKGACTEANKI